MHCLAPAAVVSTPCGSSVRGAGQVQGAHDQAQARPALEDDVKLGAVVQVAAAPVACGQRGYVRLRVYCTVKHVWMHACMHAGGHDGYVRLHEAAGTA